MEAYLDLMQFLLLVISLHRPGVLSLAEWSIFLVTVFQTTG
jgi:hypothetical protein